MRISDWSSDVCSSDLLRNSIVQYWDASSALVGTNVVYARIHQEGGEIQFAPRSGTTRLRTNARGNLLRQGANGNLAVFARDSHTRVRTVRWTTESGRSEERRVGKRVCQYV